jgi:hypothetical protein
MYAAELFAEKKDSPATGGHAFGKAYGYAG